MDIILETLDRLIDADFIMQNGGLYLVVAILFIETGILFGFFLPGDPLLFISGIIIAGADQLGHPFTNEIHNLLYWEVLFISSAIFGNFLGYWVGRKFGHLLMDQGKDYWLIKRKNIVAAQEFYQKKGGFAIVVARFLPVIRTFVPSIAGMVNMNNKKFMTFSVLGAVLWVGTLVTAGFFLGENKWVSNNLEWMMLGIVVLVTLPVVLQFILPKKKSAIKIKYDSLDNI